MFFPRKQNRLWTFLSLWSLLALSAPQLLMACPMKAAKGSTPSATHCCAKKLQADSSNGSADNAMKGCCENIPLPPSDTSGDDEKIALSKTRVETLSVSYFPTPSTPFVAASLEIFEPQSLAIVFSPTTSQRLISQHTPHSHSGRAPPI